jgi:broad specificity phosphatase PhoE
MLRFVLVRPGTTDFEEQGRIRGTLDVPVNSRGVEQAARTARELAASAIDAIYASPCQACRQTAQALAEPHDLRVRCIPELVNLNHGLWHGMLIEEVRQRQPRVYRQWQEHPETVCPPEGESLADAQQRVAEVLAKLGERHREGVVAIVAPEPLISLIRQQLNHGELGDLWKAECDCGGWVQIDVEPNDRVLR